MFLSQKFILKVPTSFDHITNLCVVNLNFGSSYGKILWLINWNLSTDLLKIRSKREDNLFLSYYRRRSIVTTFIFSLLCIKSVGVKCQFLSNVKRFVYIN